MNLSLPEVSSLAKRAARGAGYSWGLAEEAGKSTCWLCSYDLDGVRQLSLLLEQGLLGSDHRPQVKNPFWQGADVLCPLITGSYMSDTAAGLSQSGIEIRNIALPILLFPFVASIAIRREKNYSILCDDVVVAVFDGSAVNVGNLLPDYASVLTLISAGSMDSSNEPQFRATVETGSLTVLNRYAAKTFAPVSEQSRLLGAGAGLSDND